MKIERIVFIALLFLFATQIQATDYYVNVNHTNANDNNDGTSADAPWKTLNLGKLADRETDVIHVAAGNYYITSDYLIRGNVTIEGSSKDEVFILSMDDDEFFAAGNPHTGKFFDTWNNLNFTVKNVTVKNMRNIDNSNGNLTDRGIFNTDANTTLTLENVNIKNAIAERNAVMRAWGPVILKNVVIENCSLNNTGDRNFAIMGINAVRDQITKLNMEKVHILDCNSSGGSIITVEQPEHDAGVAVTSEININNCSFEGNTYAGWGSCIRAVSVEPGKTTLKLTNSFLKGNQGELVGTCFIEADRAQADNACEIDLLFQNNIFTENYASDANGNSIFGISGRDNLWTKGTLSFVNNTMLNNGINETGKEAWTFHYIQRPNATFNFINNIAVNPVNKTLIFENHPTATTGVGIIAGNLINDVGGGATNFMEKINDPEFKNEFINKDQLEFYELSRPADGSAPYMEVKAGSYNIDKGVSNELVPASDIRGAAIYNGIKDVGAYEFHPSTGTGVNNNSTTDISAYPNPFSNVINFSEKATQVDVYTINGSIILSEVNVNQINTNDLKNGIYLIRITTENGNTSTIKMLK